MYIPITIIFLILVALAGIEKEQEFKRRMREEDHPYGNTYSDAEYKKYKK